MTACIHTYIRTYVHMCCIVICHMCGFPMPPGKLCVCPLHYLSLQAWQSYQWLGFSSCVPTLLGKLLFGASGIPASVYVHVSKYTPDVCMHTLQSGLWPKVYRPRVCVYIFMYVLLSCTYLCMYYCLCIEYMHIHVCMCMYSKCIHVLCMYMPYCWSTQCPSGILVCHVDYSVQYVRTYVVCMYIRIHVRMFPLHSLLCSMNTTTHNYSHFQFGRGHYQRQVVHTHTVHRQAWVSVLTFTTGCANDP